MADGKHHPMPVCGYDQSAYIQLMYKWHDTMSRQIGSSSTFHSERAENFRQMLEKRVESVDTIYY